VTNGPVTNGPPTEADAQLAELVRVEGGRVLATLARTFGSIQVAEDAVQDAAIVALERWERDGVPDDPRAWLTVVARNKAFDTLRREGRRGEKEAAGARVLFSAETVPLPDGVVRDDQLRLIFTCCHPALAIEARVALSLRTLCGLTTAEIARALLVPEPTMAKRLVRAKQKIAKAGIPYRIPSDDELPARVPAVLAVIYLVFTEGHTASTGDALVRVDLCDEAIRLARLLHELLPNETEVGGLLALLLLTDARRATRTDGRGDLVLLPDQDRTRWDRDKIDEGAALLHEVVDAPGAGPYVLQAELAAAHSTVPSYADTDWALIADRYARLDALHPSPVIRCNRAVAVAEVDGPGAGLALLDSIEGLEGYHFFHVARGDLLARAGRPGEAVAAYELAITCSPSAPEERFLRGRLTELRVAVDA
jgi:RNA polymerase sigma-70 factor, ECF subfamily